MRAFAGVNFVHALRLNGNFAPLAPAASSATQWRLLALSKDRTSRGAYVPLCSELPLSPRRTTRKPAANGRDSSGVGLAFLLRGVAIGGACNIAHIKRN